MVLTLRVVPFCCVLIEKKAAFSMALCSYHGHCHHSTRFQIYFSPFFVLLFAVPTTPEKLSWDQSVMLETQTLILHRDSMGQDRTRREQVFLTEQKELNFCFLRQTLQWTSDTAPTEGWGRAASAPTRAALPHTAKTLTTTSNSSSCGQGRQWLPLVGFLLSLSGFCLHQLPLLPMY